MIQITDVKIRMVDTENSKLRAVASIVLDGSFAVHDIKIIEGESGYFIAMPSRKTPSGDFRDITHPINSETRDYMQREIIDAYKRELETKPV